MATLYSLICCFLFITTISAREQVCSNPNSACSGAGDAAIIPVDVAEIDNAYFIGGLFAVHEYERYPYNVSDQIRDAGIQNLEMFLHAIRTYRTRRPGSVIDEVKIGAIAFDSQSRIEQLVENIVSFETCKIAYHFNTTVRIEPRLVLAYVGPDQNNEAVQIAPLLRDMEKPHVIPVATTSVFDETDVYSYTMRSVPSQTMEVMAIVDLIESRGAKYVLTVFDDDKNGKLLKEKFETTAKGKGICAVESFLINPSNIQSTVQGLKENERAGIVVIMSNAENTRALMSALDDPALIGKFQFIAGLNWNNDPEVIRTGNNIAASAITFGVSQTPGNFTSFLYEFQQKFLALTPDNNFANPWFTRYFEDRCQCDHPSSQRVIYNVPCTTQTLAQVRPPIVMDTSLPYTMMAVDAIIGGVESARKEVCLQNGLCTQLINPANSGNQIYEGIKGVKIGGQRVFDTDGAPTSYKYDVFQYDKDGNQFIAVGDYLNGAFSVGIRLPLNFRDSACPSASCCNETETTTALPASTTYTGASQTTNMNQDVFVAIGKDTQLTGVYRYYARAETEYGTRFGIGHNWIIALGVLAGIGIIAVLVFEIYIMYLVLPNRNTSQLRTMWLGQLLLFGIFVSYLTLFAFIFVPTKTTCGITRFGVGVSYAICFSVLLVKLMVILTSRPTAMPHDPYIMGEGEGAYLKGTYQFLMFVFAFGVQIVIDIQWLIQVPPEAVLVKTFGGEKAWVCNHYTWSATGGPELMENFVRSAFENHLISLVYVMFLILIITIVALKAHGIITNHRESVFIGLSAGFTIPIWLAWTLIAGLNLEDDYAHEYADACLAFGLFTTATLILFTMFLPKVRQLVSMGVAGIYLEDDRDTYAGGSIYGVPPSYKSKPSSMIYVNNTNPNHAIYSEPNILHGVPNGDPRSLHLKHPRSTAASMYSAPPTYSRRPDSTYGPGSKVLRVTPELTGKGLITSERRRPHSEYAYPTARSTKSEKSTMKRSRSQQDLGAL